MSNKKHGMDKDTKIQKGVEGQCSGKDGGMRGKAHRKGSYMHREESIQARTTIHLQVNRNFGGY